MKKLLPLLSIPLLMYACGKYEAPKYDEVWFPIYGDTSITKIIKSEDAKPILSTGKIYLYNNYIFQIEHGIGIHVFEFEGKIPKRISFISVYGAQELSIKNNILYTNNLNDLVSINIDDIKNVKVVDRDEELFEMFSPNHPPVNTGYFECVDPEKGPVIGWKLMTDTLASCRYN